MNENNFGGLDDIDYSAKPSENNGPTGVSAPVLDDIDYVPPSAKKGGPTGVSAPVLDDMDAYVSPVKEKKARLQEFPHLYLTTNRRFTKPKKKKSL